MSEKLNDEEFQELLIIQSVYEETGTKIKLL